MNIEKVKKSVCKALFFCL